MHIPRLSILTFAGILGLAVCLPTSSLEAQTATGGGSTTKMRNAIETKQAIEAKARDERADDESSIQALASEIRSVTHAYPRLPSEIESLIRKRLVAAEMAYLQGKGQGVREEGIVRLIDLLATKFGAPDYVRTSPQQVRVLRMGLLLETPVFMGQGLSRRDMAVGDSISPVMSPLQAAHVTATLIDQKLLNPDYQVAPEEWDAKSYKKFSTKTQTQLDLQQSGQLEALPRTARVTIRENTKRKEIQEAVSPAISSMALVDWFPFVDQALECLGDGN